MGFGVAKPSAILCSRLSVWGLGLKLSGCGSFVWPSYPVRYATSFKKKKQLKHCPLPPKNTYKNKSRREKTHTAKQLSSHRGTSSRVSTCRSSPRLSSGVGWVGLRLSFGFRVEGLRVKGLGFGVWGLGFGVYMENAWPSFLAPSTVLCTGHPAGRFLSLRLTRES